MKNKSRKPAPKAMVKKPVPRRPAPAPRKPAPVALRRPTAARTPTQATTLAKPRPPTPVAAAAADPLDVAPSRRIPGVYTGEYKGEHNHCFIAYKRTDIKVYTVFLGQPISLVEWDPEDFDKQLHVTKLRDAAYPLKRAVDIFRGSYNGHTDKALRILRRLAADRSVDEEDTLEDLLDPIPTMRRVSTTSGRTEKTHRQALPKDERLAKRRKRRQERLAKMTPAEYEAWKTRRKARRAARRLLKRKSVAP
jgi:hypothetical protein